MSAKKKSTTTHLLTQSIASRMFQGARGDVKAIMDRACRFSFYSEMFRTFGKPGDEELSRFDIAYRDAATLASEDAILHPQYRQCFCCGWVFRKEDVYMGVDVYVCQTMPSLRIVKDAWCYAEQEAKPADWRSADSYIPRSNSRYGDLKRQLHEELFRSLKEAPIRTSMAISPSELREYARDTDWSSLTLLRQFDPLGSKIPLIGAPPRGWNHALSLRSGPL